jgi:hypothetical protein
MSATSGPSSDLRRKLVLTYDNTQNLDGAGAQLQRIYGTYAVSRFLRASYLHTPISRVDYQGFAALKRNVIDPNYHRPLNDLFQIESDLPQNDDFHKVALPNISLEIVEQLVAEFDSGATGGRPSLVELTVPYGIADRFPDCYEACKDISPFAPPVRDGRALRVAIHVRRGELLVVESHRMLPNAYYVSVAQNVALALSALGVDYQIELHTETADDAFMVPVGYPGLLNRIPATVISPDMNRLDEFDVLPHLIRCFNEDTIDCLRQLATADVLVMSRSSFSYVAGILNKTGIILCFPFWHSALRSWLTVDPDGQFDRFRFGQAVDVLRGQTMGAHSR